MIPKPDWTEADTQRALQFWDEYQKQHDVSALTGQAVGIEPKSGRVFFGDSAKEIMLRREKDEGLWEPLLFLRVGFGYYLRKRSPRRRIVLPGIGENTMSESALQTDPELKRVFEIWAEYQKTHDVSALHGKPVGIDPVGGGVWIGDSARDVSDQARAVGVNRVIGFRIGLGYYLRKGGRR